MKKSFWKRTMDKFFDKKNLKFYMTLYRFFFIHIFLKYSILIFMTAFIFAFIKACIWNLFYRIFQPIYERNAMQHTISLIIHPVTAVYHHMNSILLMNYIVNLLIYLFNSLF